MENDKMFEFMTKMYSEMKEGFNKVDVRLDKVDARLDKIEITLGNEIKPNIKASLEGYSQVCEKLEVLEEKVDALAEKQSNQEVEIRVIKGDQIRKII